MMKDLFPHWPVLEKLLAGIDGSGGNKTAVNAQAGIPYLAVRAALLGKSVVVVTEEEKAEDFAEDAKTLASIIDPAVNWSIGFLPAGMSKEKNALLEESIQSDRLLWFCSQEAFLEKTYSRRDFLESRLMVKVGKVVKFSSLLDHVSNNGYKRTGFVEETGEFAFRGEVFDFWSPNCSRPVRLIFDNDVVESMHFFDISTQRTVDFLPETIIIPVAEKRLEKKIFTGTVREYLPDNSCLVLDGMRLAGGNAADFLSFDMPVIDINPSGTGLNAVPPARVRLNWKFFKRELQENARKGLRSFVFCGNMGESERLEDILDELRSGENERPRILVSALNDGFVCPDIGLYVWSFTELTGARPASRRMPKFKVGRTLDSMSEIHAGDYVVHENYGIGRYRGLERVSLRSGTRSALSGRKEKLSEFLALEYKGGDRLLVPVQDFRLVQKFIGDEGKKLQLNSLDGAAWERTKDKVREEIVRMAKDLLETAAMRAIVARGSGAGANNANAHLLKEFAEAFPYEETPDQSAAIAEIEKDLDSNLLMDRVVCGDVGYGKTEVAMRAAFKMVSDSKQVLVLVPTTILAEQHFKTFSERFAAFPVKIAMVSRFQNEAGQNKVLADLKEGHIDIVIGTHRLLQKDVQVKNLGLVIIDEEHRFGVQQKEYMKRFKLNVDVLSLSATPIPRTLSQGLGGIREISVIETPPEGRQPIETRVDLFNEKVIQDAILKELGRGGQVFYVHNRIATIENCRKMLEKILPGVSIGVAHGQMKADVLEKAMWNFLHKKWNVLLATSIIESGLDIPSVNTLIVEDSEEFGLAQLYQLRGRVGRKRDKAYCYLFFSEWSDLSEDARKRLEAIQEFSALGSGMKLAVRDLEIRGTGNLLGAEQHGWINAVGLELYCQLLSQEIKRLKEEKGLAASIPEKVKPEIWPEVELDMDAYIPEEYVEPAGERIFLYKKIIASRTGEDVEKIREEFLDRFGPLPEPVENLLHIVGLKMEAVKAGIASISETDKGVVLGWNVTEQKIPIDLQSFAKDHSQLIEILPPDSIEVKKGIIGILFKRGEDLKSDKFKTIQKCLRTSSQYVTIDNYEK